MIPDLPYEIINNTPLTCFTGICNSKLHLVHTKAEWDAVFEVTMKRKRISADTETNGLRYYAGDKIVGISFGWHDTHFYIPVRHEASELGGDPIPQLSMDEIRPDLQKLFSRKDLLVTGHNFALFDRHFFRAEGIEITCPIVDTMVLWHFVDENAPKALKDISSGWLCKALGIRKPGIVHKDAAKDEKYLKEWRRAEAMARRKVHRQAILDKVAELQSLLEYQGRKKNELKRIAKDLCADHKYANVSVEDVHYGHVPVLDMVKYAALDTFLCEKVYEYSLPKVKENPKVWKIFLNECELTKALFDAEEHGLYVDIPYLKKLQRQYDVEISTMEIELRQDFGNINLNSTDQLARFLALKGVKLTEKTKTGNWKLDKVVLTELSKTYEPLKKLLELRKLIKLKNTYVDSLLEKVDSNGAVHARFNQNVDTGRMSVMDPNLSNLPTGNKDIKKAFISPGADYYNLLLDYSQVEVRLAAHFSEDEGLLNAYAQNKDVHSATAGEMFGWTYEQVEKGKDDKKDPNHAMISRDRRAAKIITFGIIYGVGAPGLSQQIPRPEEYKNRSDKEWIARCQDFIDRFFEVRRGVKKMIIRSNRFVKTQHHQVNAFGRVRKLPHANICRILKDNDLGWIEARAQRQGCNFVVQGTAADVFKYASVAVHKLLEGKKSKLVNWVHDEIYVYLHKDELYLVPLIKKELEKFPQFKVPLLSECSISTTSWGDKTTCPSPIAEGPEEGLRAWIENLKKEQLAA